MISPCSVQTNLQGEELRDHGTHLFPVACYLDILPGDEIPCTGIMNWSLAWW